MLLWGWRGRTPRQPRWAMDGPSRRAHGAGPERGTPERSEGRTQGRKRFGYFAAFAIGIGDGHLAAPLPHHPACGSAPGGSRS